MGTGVSTGQEEGKEGPVRSCIIKQLWRCAAALGLLTFIVLMPFEAATAVATPTAGASASIGVFIDQPTTTLPPTTLPPAPPATTPPAPVTTPPTVPPTTVPTTVPNTTAPPDTLPQVLPQPTAVTPAPVTGLSATVRSAVRTTKELVKSIISGKPVADVAAAILPKNVATVVVPAVRTAATFVFPIGLAVAVIAFLALQQRIDSSDPKLTAAPIAHDDDVVTFT